MSFFDALDRSIEPLARGLDARSRRHSTLAANVANADTPGYRAVDVSFEGLLAGAGAGLPLVTTHATHLGRAGAAGGDRVVLSGGATRRDGNDVDIDREMGKLARNQIEYQFLARTLGRRFNKLREAITGRASA